MIGREPCRAGPRAAFILALLGLGILAVSGCRGFGPSRVVFSQSAARVEAYDFVEVTAAVGSPRAGAPFVDASLVGAFERSDGTGRRRVEGFCDAEDGSVFRIRFMPDVPGRYRYEVTYRQGGTRSRHEGTFEAVDARRRGPIRVDPAHPWHFVWEGTGEHYFFNGATAYWLMGWRDDAVIRDAIARFARLKVNRIRVTIAGRSNLTYGEPVMPGGRWTSFVTPWPAQQPEDIFHPGFDYRKFDLDYWRKFDRALAFARDRDVVVSLVLDMNDGRVHPEAGGADELRFMRYAIARFSAFSNVTWDLGDDLNAYRTDAWTRRTGELIKGWDPYKHLATSHPDKGDNDHQDRTADWFDFTSFQNWSRGQHAFMLAERRKQAALGRIIPQTNEEYGYEDHYPLWAPKPDAESADTLRRMAWEIVMAGGYQTTGESARRGTNVWPDTGGGWMNGRGDDTMTMLDGYAHMVEFFEGFDWWKTEPHDELVTGRAYCLAQPGETYAAYLPHGGRTTIDLAEGAFDAEWFDATTGRTRPLGTVEGPRWTSPDSPGPGDWALLLRRHRTGGSP